jgi:hypothetical protein
MKYISIIIMTLTTPKSRLDVLRYINNMNTFDEIMNSTTNLSKCGFLYETIVILCMVVKQLIPNYEAISDSILSKESMVFKNVKSIKELFNKNLYDGNNLSDISVNIPGKGWTPWSVKYKDTKGDSDLVPINTCMETYSTITGEMYSLGYVVKDISKLTNHHNPGRPEAMVIQKARIDKHLLDEKDVRKAFTNFQNILIRKKLTSNSDVIDWIDATYLHTGRVHLHMKFHQILSLYQFIDNVDEGELTHCLSHKPRSGKTITMLLMARYLLNNGYKRVLIMTSVPDTINNFIYELDTYYEFKGIKYKEQKDYMSIDDTFTGIALCSVQYLKTQYETKKKGNLLLFDCNIFDECHFHSSNKNTLDKIINVHDDKIMQVFASGTSGKTVWFYDISSKCIYKWAVEDECMMKKYVM